jgi:hypothetical protein
MNSLPFSFRQVVAAPLKRVMPRGTRRTSAVYCGLLLGFQSRREGTKRTVRQPIAQSRAAFAVSLGGKKLVRLGIIEEHAVIRSRVTHCIQSLVTHCCAMLIRRFHTSLPKTPLGTDIRSVPCHCNVKTQRRRFISSEVFGVI